MLGWRPSGRPRRFASSFRPAGPRSANGRSHPDRAANQVAVQSQDLRCLGLLTPQQAEQLKACGVDRVNHNLNTSEAHYAEICSTHTYQDRVATLQAVRNAGMELCSGGIVGMGEADEDVVRMAFALRDLNVESIPVNFLNPIDGTPLAGVQRLNPPIASKCWQCFGLPILHAKFAFPAAANCTWAACKHSDSTRPIRSSSVTI